MLTVIYIYIYIYTTRVFVTTAIRTKRFEVRITKLHFDRFEPTTNINITWTVLRCYYWAVRSD